MEYATREGSRQERRLNPILFVTLMDDIIKNIKKKKQRKFD